MSDIHSTITTTSGCLFYQLISFAFEVSLRKSGQIYLIAVSGSVPEEGSVVHCHRRHSSSTLSHLNRERERERKCTQGQIEAVVPCEKAFVGLG